MLDAEKLLGGLVIGGLRRKSGRGLGMKGAAGMAVLGVAMAAFEHFLRGSSTPSGSSPPPPPQTTSSSPPPPPGSAPITDAKPVVPPSSETVGNKHAILLIKAMISAANADRTISQEERDRVLDRMRCFGMTSEEQSYIENELLTPATIDEITNQVKTPDEARQVYAASLLAIEVDTDAEREYMRILARRLGLDEAAVSEIHQVLGLQQQI